MGLKNLLSFSTGELAPILHDRVTLEKFNKGLATCRNTMIGKTGSLISRFGTINLKAAKNNNQAIKLFCPPNSNILTEWGHQYVRCYTYDETADDFDITLIGTEQSHIYLESDLENMHFVYSKDYIWVFVYGKVISKLYCTTSTVLLIDAANAYPEIAAPTALSITEDGSTPSTGYDVDYKVTKVINGEESLAVEDVSGNYQRPIEAAEKNTIIVTVGTLSGIIPDIRVYRRPHEGSGYGYIGSSTYIYSDSGVKKAKFEDLGGDADFSNSPPTLITTEGLSSAAMSELTPKTGAVYQQRLIVANVSSSSSFSETILTSRPGLHNNFYRDHPYDDDSALNFKSGTTGKASVLRIVDNDGLIVFTSVGVYVSVGTLSVDNIAMTKKGSWVINDKIPPLSVPGGVFFVDKNTNSIRLLVYSQDILTYQSIDLTVFSNHLFKNKTITSWCYQDGVVPLILATFSDGSLASFTYDFEHEMKAWTRHDFVYPVEQVEGTGNADLSFMVVDKDGQRYIEATLPRYALAEVYEDNSEADMLAFNQFMDSMKIKQNLLNDSLDPGDEFEVTPVVTDDWEGSLTLTCGTSALFTAATFGAVGTIMRFFDTEDNSVVDLEVTARASDDEVTVTPSAEFPEDQASDFRLYETFTTMTGLGHLEGENVSLVVDGAVVNSPYNDVDGYTAVTVASGAITIPGGERGAIAVAGRPIVADIKTLNITTLEQKPTMLESINVNKVYVRVNDTTGLYLSNKFPEEASGETDGTSVDGMEDLDVYDDISGTSIIGNRYKQPASKRLEITIPGAWDNQGQISIRQVDPLHFEILSIIPDVEVLHRSDR